MDSVGESFTRKSEIVFTRRCRKVSRRKLIEKSFSQIVLVDHAVLITPPKIYRQTPIITAQSPKQKKLVFTSQKNFTKIFIGTHRLQFWHLCPHFFANVKKNFRPKSDIAEKVFFSKKKSFQWNSPLDKQKEVTITLPNVLLGSQKSFCSIREETGKRSSFFLQNVRLETWMDVLTFRAQVSDESPEKICSLSENNSNKGRRFWRKVFSRKIFWTRRVQFWERCAKKFFENFFCCQAERKEKIKQIVHKKSCQKS